jgi:hypothetical protein
MNRWLVCVGALASLNSAAVWAQSPQPVTIDNFVRAESDMYLAAFVKESGGLGKLTHRREVASIDNQTVIRLNRDTLYSSAVFDLDAGPVTVTLPDMGSRFMSMMVVSEDHYVPAVIYSPGPHEITRELVGTRYAAVAIRTLVDPNDPADVQAARALQDGITAKQARPGTFEIPQWDPVSQKQVRDALLVLASTTSGFRGAFGKQGEVDPVRRLLGAAAGWGGNPDEDAIYVGEAPARNDGVTVHLLTVKARFVHDQQHYREEGRRWLDDGAIRRLRRQDPELHPHHEGLELHGKAVPSARRDPGRQLEIPGSPAG